MKAGDARASKNQVMSSGEKELWESGDWREHVKDLNASFSKVSSRQMMIYQCFFTILVQISIFSYFPQLPPISKGKKRRGRGEAFTVES